MRLQLTAALVLFAALIGLAACDADDPALDGGSGDTGPRPDAGVDAGPPPDDSPYKGPWVQRPSANEVTVRWESRLAPDTVAVEVTQVGGGEASTFTGGSTETVTRTSHGVGTRVVERPDVPGTYYLNEVELSGLAAGTCYTYAIAGWADDGGRFCTLRAATDQASPIRFYAIGDTSPGFMNTLRVIAAARPEETDFTVHLGDIQYYSTIVESQQLWFEEMAPLLRANAFLPCIGNHEIDEIPHEYEDYYQRLFTPAGREGEERWYTFASGGVRFFSLSSEHGLAPGSEQVQWLEAELMRAEAEPEHRFSVIYMHRPLYTLGDFRPREEMREALFPILAAHRIPLVLSGHVHGYERFEFPDTTHVISGAGGFLDQSLDQHAAEYPDDATHRAAAGLFYQSMIIEITENGDGDDVIRGAAIDDTGAVRDRFERTVTRP